MSSRLLSGSHGHNVRPWQIRSRESHSPTGLEMPDRPPEVVEERRNAVQSEIDRLQQELDDARLEGYRSGFADGKSATENALRQELEVVAGRLAQSISLLAEMKPRIRREAEKELLELCFAVARRVVHRELTLDPDCVMGLLQAGLAKVSRTDLQAVHLHPQFVGRVTAELESLGVTNVEVVPDNTLALGDMLYQTSRGTLDAKLETHFSEIVYGLADHI